MNLLKLKHSLFVFAALLISSVSYSQNYVGKKAAYLPDEDKTYIMDDISIGTDSQGNWQATFNNVTSELSGDQTPAVLNDNPSYRPKWKWDHKRHVVDTPTRHVVCVTGGNLCVIIISD